MAHANILPTPVLPHAAIVELKELVTKSTIQNTNLNTIDVELVQQFVFLLGNFPAIIPTLVSLCLTGVIQTLDNIATTTVITKRYRRAVLSIGILEALFPTQAKLRLELAELERVQSILAAATSCHNNVLEFTQTSKTLHTKIMKDVKISLTKPTKTQKQKPSTKYSDCKEHIEWSEIIIIKLLRLLVSLNAEQKQTVGLKYPHVQPLYKKLKASLKDPKYVANAKAFMLRADGVIPTDTFVLDPSRPFLSIPLFDKMSASLKSKLEQLKGSLDLFRSMNEEVALVSEPDVLRQFADDEAPDDICFEEVEPTEQLLMKDSTLPIQPVNVISEKPEVSDELEVVVTSSRLPVEHTTTNTTPLFPLLPSLHFVDKSLFKLNNPFTRRTPEMANDPLSVHDDALRDIFATTQEACLDMMHMMDEMTQYTIDNQTLPRLEKLCKEIVVAVKEAGELFRSRTPKRTQNQEEPNKRQKKE